MEIERLRALLYLVDDPDPQVQSHIEEMLLTAGQSAIPLLEQKWLETSDPLIQQRIEELLELVQLETIGQLLYEWRLAPEQPLFTALIYVAQLRYPSLNISKYTSAYRRLIHTTWLQMSPHGDPFEKLLVINRQLFVQERFQAEVTRPATPRYYYINEVIDTRRGNSFSLAVLYYLLASELGLQVSMVPIGSQYLVRYFDGNLHFYIDPYRKGYILLAAQLKQALRNAGLSENLAHYASLSHPYIILRLIMHLEDAYERAGELDKKMLFATLRERIHMHL
ncbi:MAG: transglutaminase family protein [Bacteroidia bacterium]|nr:transglutaminase family protein [Bacteroidia bacterium]